MLLLPAFFASIVPRELASVVFDVVGKLFHQTLAVGHVIAIDFEAIEDLLNFAAILAAGRPRFDKFHPYQVLHVLFTPAIGAIGLMISARCWASLISSAVVT